MGSRSEPNSAATAPPPYGVLRGASLFLDFDGTLVEIATRPDAVVVDARLRDLLPRLDCLLKGRLAIVSGRPVEQISAFFPDMALSVSGSHGLELRRAGEAIREPDSPAWIATAARRAEELRRDHPGVLVEIKPFGIALHYRQAPDAEAACRALAEDLAGPEQHLQPGKMVMEVRQAGGDKGGAVRVLMEDPHMAGTRPLFIGDDLTDEPAFRAAAELGGAGILVGPVRESAAAYRIDGVAAAIAWLESAIEACA